MPLNIDLRAINAASPATFSNDDIEIIDMHTDYYTNLYTAASGCERADVDVREIVGSAVPANAGTWGGVLANGTKRQSGRRKMDNCLSMLDKSPDFLFGQNQTSISLIEVDGKYYQDGDGIHRVITSKFFAAFNTDVFIEPTLKAVSVLRYRRRQPFYAQYDKLMELLAPRPHLKFAFLDKDANGDSWFSITNTCIGKEKFTASLHFHESQTEALIMSLGDDNWWWNTFTRKGRFLSSNGVWAQGQEINPWGNIPKRQAVYFVQQTD